MLFKNGRSTQKITAVHKLLHVFFIFCESEGYIAKNPCSKGLVNIPQNKDVDVDIIIEKKKVPFNYFRDDEVPILREEFKGNKYEKVVDFALGTGMREGEIVGLKWIHLNFEKKEIYVKIILLVQLPLMMKEKKQDMKLKMEHQKQKVVLILYQCQTLFMIC